MSDVPADDDSYVYDEDSGEWISAADAAAKAAASGAFHAVDSNGAVLADGDSVVLIRDLAVKGAGQTLKRGTLVKGIRLTANPEEIDCRTGSIKGLVLRTEFVKKA